MNDQLREYSVGTPEQQTEVTRAGTYVENKIFIDVDKEQFSDGEGGYIFTGDFQFLTLNLLDCYRATKDTALEMKTLKSQSNKVDDASETKSYKDNADMFNYRGIICDEDTITSLLGYSENYGVGNMTVDI